MALAAAAAAVAAALPGAASAAGRPIQQSNARLSAAACEWYGTLELVEKNDGSASGDGWTWSDHTTETTSFVSQPAASTGQTGTCEASWTQSYNGRFLETHGCFIPPGATSYVNIVTEGSGGSSGSMTASLLDWGGGAWGLEAYGYGGSTPTTRKHETQSCGGGVSRWEDAGVTREARLASPNAECREALRVAGPNVQAEAGTCTLVREGGDSRGESKWTWSFRRVECNQAVDTDGDGLGDCREHALGTDPGNPDTDGDGLSDGDEVARGTDPRKLDSDGDGLSDGREVGLGTNPQSSDSDGGGVSDGAEVNRGTNPLNPADDTPPAPQPPVTPPPGGGGDDDAIKAVDDGLTIVEYPANGVAPPVTLDLLKNDIGSDLWITSPRVDWGQALAPNIGSGDRGQVRYAPPFARFVGPLEVTYGIRTGSDSVGTVRGTATWRLSYRQCNDHTIDLEGKTSEQHRITAARASGRYRVCTDGTTATGKVVSVDARVPVVNRLLSRAVDLFLRSVTRGAIRFEITGRWEKSQPGASSLSANLIFCETWRFGARARMLSRSDQERLRTILKRFLPDRAVNVLMRRLVLRITSPHCASHLRYKAGPVTSSPTGYSFPLQHNANTMASPIIFASITTEVGSTRFKPHPRNYALVCPYERPDSGGLGLETCRVRAN